MSEPTPTPDSICGHKNCGKMYNEHTPINNFCDANSKTDDFQMFTPATPDPEQKCGHSNCGKTYAEHDVDDLRNDVYCFGPDFSDKGRYLQTFTPSSDKPEQTHDPKVRCYECGGAFSWHEPDGTCRNFAKTKYTPIPKEVEGGETPTQHNETTYKMNHPHKLPDVYYIVRQITTGCYLAGEKDWMTSIQYAMPFATRNDAIDYMKDTKTFSAVEIVEIYNVTEP